MRYYYLMPISCHFRDCIALLSAGYASSAIHPSIYLVGSRFRKNKNTVCTEREKWGAKTLQMRNIQFNQSINQSIYQSVSQSVNQSTMHLYSAEAIRISKALERQNDIVRWQNRKVLRSRLKMLYIYKEKDEKCNKE